MIKNEAYVVNLHILEQCNYKCKYCFAHYEDKKILPIEDWIEIIDNISNSIPVKRFNIAGGEPLLYPKINELIEYIKSKNIHVSIITNGILLNESFIERHSNNLDTIGISMDSLNESTLYKLGCNTYKNDILTFDKLKKLSNIINTNGIKLKINTVVTKENYKENLSEKLSEININRWKVLKMKPFKNESFCNFSLDISDEEFIHFIKINSDINNMVVEKSMLNSYIIIDSSGYLLDSSQENYSRISYAKSKDFKDDFKKFKLDIELYNDRYKTLNGAFDE